MNRMKKNWERQETQSKQKKKKQKKNEQNILRNKDRQKKRIQTNKIGYRVKANKISNNLKNCFWFFSIIRNAEHQWQKGKQYQWQKYTMEEDEGKIQM